MTVVRNTVSAPGGGALANARVRINVVTRSAAAPAYTAGGDIVGILDIRTDAAGFWSADLAPNASLTPANTYYRVVESSAVSTFVVPASGGPYNLSEVLAASPPTPSAPGMTGVQAAANGTVAGVRPEINLVAGANTTVTAADNPGQNRVDFTISSSGGGGGGTPSSTVVSEGAYGQSAAAGSATAYSRGDHTHGSPSLASSAAAASAIGDTAAAGTATTAARADHVHGREGFGAVSPQTSYGGSSSGGSAATVAHSDHTHGTPALTTTAPATALGVGQAASLGTATLPSLADHVHPTAAAGVPGPSALGDTAAAGTATTPAASDHRHGRESFGGAPATTLAIGTAAAAGSALTPAHSDHVHPMAASATAGASAVGDTAAAGAAGTFAASDHRHGRETFAAPAAATSYGLSAVTGSAATVAHSDHTHGSPALTTTAPATTLAIGTAAALGTAVLPALADHVHPMAASAAAGASAVGDTASSGAAGTFAASDHRHSRESFASPGSSAVGDAAAAGTSLSVAHADHTHGREAFGAVTALSAFNTASSNGSAATVAHSDHTHGAPALPAATTGVAGIVQFDPTVADLQPNGVAALGANGKTVDSGHSHPSPPHQFPITKYGAVGDIQCVIDGAMNASAVLTSAAGKFVAGDVGKAIVVKGALTSGQTSLVTTIASYQSATQVTLTAAATVVTGTALQVIWGTDNTSFIQSAIADAFAYAQAHGRVGEVYTPPATGLGWMVSGALKLTDGTNAIYNSQLTIPLNSDRNPKVTIVFRGAANSGSTRHWNQDYPAFNPSTWFSAGAFDTQAHQATTGVNAISNAGNPSVLGGPTGKNGYGVTGTNPVYDNVLVELRDMSIMTTHSASGWTYCPFNFHGCAGAHLTNCSFGTNGVIQYYTGGGGSGGNTDFLTVSTLSGGASNGGLLPGAGNNASNRIENCVWNGGYTYGPLITEHTVIDDVTILYCWSGFCPVGTYGDGGSGAGALHAIAFNQLCVEACSYHINVFGAGAGGIGPILHGVLDTEGTIQCRDNPNNGTGLAAAAGEIRLAGSPSTVAISVGTGTGASGGTGLRIIKEQIYSGPLTFTSSPTLAINTPVVNTTWRPVTLYLTGGTGITTVQIGKLAGGASPTMATVLDFTAGGVVPANTPIRLGPGQWLQINGTTLPTVVSCIAD